MRLRQTGSAILIAASWTSAAQALTVDVSTREPSLVGQPFTFKAVASDAVGAVQYKWDFGDGTSTEFELGRVEITHTYQTSGHYSVIALIKDEMGNFTSVPFVHTVHYPLPPTRPSVSSEIVYDETRNLVYNVNPDSDTITAIDASALGKVKEIPVYQGPKALAVAPDGKLWVIHRDDYAVAVIDLDRWEIERGFRLPYASQPIGLAMSPTGDAAYVTLLALGKLLKLNPVTGDIIAELGVGPWARGVSVSHDGKDVYVTRFISADTHGEVVHVDGASLTVVKRIELAKDTTTADSDQQGRGLPNYVFSVALSPDGRQAWIPSKKDNILRGLLRDTLPLTQDNTVRPMVAVVDLLSGTELFDRRMDLDDRNLPSHVHFSPLGDYAFVSVIGSSLVEVRDAYTGGFVTALSQAGAAPTGAVLGPDQHLFVHSFLTRSVVVYDVSDILSSADFTSRKVTEISSVEKEKLDPEVLRGKQVFYDSQDTRMTLQGYISCASCHLDGFEDGRVWDFTALGEGLRNTTSLLGRRGMGHGRSRWAGNFDEIQDFENEIRTLFNGRGFLPEELFSQGTRSDPLGDPKAGLDSDLDALAAYVSSLDHVHPSPFRNADGSMTPDAEAGQKLFFKLGCDFCHVEPDFTDSARGLSMANVGTIKPTSGTRSGAPLLGIDTPTLLGVWETAPYLHDGSAATLRDVLTTANPNDDHGFISSLSPTEVDQLVAFLLQLDNETEPRTLPFEVVEDESDSSGCACTVGSATRTPNLSLGWAIAPFVAWVIRRRRQAQARNGSHEDPL